MKNKTIERVYSWVVVSLGILQVSIVLISWIVSAIIPSGSFHSLLSSEGVRWYFGQFMANLSSPLLMALVLGCMAYGAVTASGILLFDKKKYRHRIAMNLSVAELLLIVLVMLLLTLAPHAILLSVTGNLFPSSFSASIIPVLSFTVILVSESFALMSGRFHSLSDVVFSMTAGIRKGAPLFLLYIISFQSFYSLLFVLGK